MQNYIHPLRWNYYTEMEIIEKYYKSKNRLLLLDYDGTLIGLKKRPELAVPNGRIKNILHFLESDNKNRTVLISGRDYTELAIWFKDLSLEIFAEHGAWGRKNKVWQSLVQTKQEWKEKILVLLQNFKRQAPFSLIENKSYSLAWHYRNCNKRKAEEIKEKIVALIKKIKEENDYPISLLQGDKVLEIKNKNVAKGNIVKEIIAKNEYDFILSIGDDITDESMFQQIPQKGISIKVGEGKSYADYSIPSEKEVIILLMKLSLL
ncbi:MAG TPA: trehalose-phosphatase [Chitinophagaceae bacterium]|nr:trehalose-phosphatase [Chitinophagaceae bacterium]